MAYLLYLDTSANATRVMCLKQETILAERVIPESRDHGQYIHTLIDEVLREAQLSLNQLKGIVILNGPGSYTGLRIALSVAKGICYAIQIPLYLLHKLHVTAIATLEHHPPGPFSVIARARAGEYFYAAYNQAGQVLQEATLMQSTQLQEITIPLFTFQSPEACAWEGANTVNLQSTTLAQCSFDAFLNEKKADLVSAEPFYLKNVYINKINKL